MSEFVLRKQQLAGGTVREWMMAGKPYTETAEQQAEVEAAIADVRWQRPDRPMAMSPGLLIREVVRKLNLRIVASVGLSSHVIMVPEFPEAHDPDHWMSCTLVGIRLRHVDGWWVIYLLDIGVGAVWLVSDFTPEPIPPAASVGCALEWHDRCRGRMRRGTTWAPCQCGCHGEASSPDPLVVST